MDFQPNNMIRYSVLEQLEPLLQVLQKLTYCLQDKVFLRKPTMASAINTESN